MKDWIIACSMIIITIHRQKKYNVKPISDLQTINK
jgi:hypothetical protein